MEPLISFVITYHSEPEAFLLSCLESVRALHLAEGEAEVIIVDDGKTLADFPLQGERLIRQEQAGLSVARNTGIEACRGRYIQFIDADDCLIPGAYEAVLEQLRGEQADVVMFRMTKQSTTVKPLPSPPKERGTEAWLQTGKPTASRTDGSPFLWWGSGRLFLLHRNLRAAAWGYAFRRKVLGDLRFHPGLLHEDELFTPQLILRAQTLVEIKAKAYFYRQHAGTITSTKSSAKIQKRLDDIHFIISTLQCLENPLLERRIRQLTVDYMQKTWTLTHSFRELRRRSRELRREGFLPLPVRCYSLRYWLASLVSRVFL